MYNEHSKLLLETTLLYKDHLLKGKQSTYIKINEDLKKRDVKEKLLQIDEIKNFDELEIFIKDCLKCRLGKSRNNIVVGSGDVNASLYVVGEAPGLEEDIQGKPFVGRSGKFIREELRKKGLTEDDMYITNVVKCRPPNNRDPQLDEIESCKGYLKKQLALSRPKVILALGRFAGSYILDHPEKPYSLVSMRGKVHQVHQSSCIVTYHPSALLRGNKQWLEFFYQDLELLKQCL